MDSNFLNEVELNKVIVIDNALFNSVDKNLKLIFIPPYYPKLNPIEKYW